MADDFHPEQFTDTYQEQLKASWSRQSCRAARRSVPRTSPSNSTRPGTSPTSWPNFEASVRKRRGESGDIYRRSGCDEGARLSNGPGEKAPRKATMRKRRRRRRAAAKK